MNDVDQLRQEFQDLGSPPRLRARPQSITGDRRTLWRLSVVCLLLHKGRMNTLAIEHLHVLWWASRSNRARDQFKQWWHGEREPQDLLPRFDPSLSFSLDLAQGFGLIAVNNSDVTLTAKGRDLAERVEADGDVLAPIAAFLNDMPGKLTKTKFRTILEWH